RPKPLSQAINTTRPGLIHPVREYIALWALALFRSDGRRRLLDFSELRLEATLQHPVEAVEIEVNHRRDVERQELRHHKTADHRHAERLAQFGARAGTQRDWQRAEDRGERGHHDRTKTKDRCFADGGFRGQPNAPSFNREV